MTFEQIKLEMAKRLGDPDYDKTRALVGRAFEQAVSELSSSEDVRPEEIPALMINESLQDDGSSGLRLLIFENHIASIEYPSDMSRFIDLSLHSEYGQNLNLMLKRVSWEDIKRTKLESAFKPAGNECFYYFTTNRIELLLSENFEGHQMILFVMHYITNPDMDDWTSGTNLVTDLGYGRGFIYRCIDLAVSRFSKTSGE